MLQKPGPGEPATVVLADGKSHTLRYPLRILKQLKTEHRIDVLSGGAQLGTVLNDPDKLAVILAMGLRTADPSITTEWVEDNVDASMLTQIAPMLVYASTGQWIDLDRLASPNGAASSGSADGSPSTGSDSGPRDATTSV